MIELQRSNSMSPVPWQKVSHPLDPGETGYVPSPAFTWNIHEDKLQAVIMLFTEKGLQGICVTRTLDVKK